MGKVGQTRRLPTHIPSIRGGKSPRSKSHLNSAQRVSPPEEARLRLLNSWNITNEQVWENPNGRPSLDLGYNTGKGEQYHDLIKNGKASSRTTPKPGAVNDDPNASVMAARAAKMQKNAEKVRSVDVDANKGLCARLASGNVGGNPKKRSKNSFGGETVKGTGEDN